MLSVIKALEQLNNEVKRIKVQDEFHRFALNNKALAEILVKQSKNPDDITSHEEFKIYISNTYRLGALRSYIDFFRWNRKCSIIELSTQALSTSQSGSILLPIMALRSILEMIGNISLLKKDIDSLQNNSKKIEENMTWLYDIESSIDSRIAGVRIDYYSILNNRIDSDTKIKYKPNENYIDLSAKDLLNGVDNLGKTVKGIRNTYDLFCEFTHPNLATSFTNYDSVKINSVMDDVFFYSVKYNRKSIGNYFTDQFGPALTEAIQIVTASVNEAIKIDRQLQINSDDIFNISRKVIRALVKNRPYYFDKRQNCPCNSGQNIRSCCGELINSNKFGNFTFQNLM